MMSVARSEVRMAEAKKEDEEEKDFTPYGWFVLALFIAVRVSHQMH